MTDQELHLRKLIDDLENKLIQKIDEENTALRALLIKCRFYVANWEAYDDDSANERIKILIALDAVSNAQKKKQP